MAVIAKTDFRVLRILRLFSILKVNRYTVAFRRIVNVIQKKASELISALFILLVLFFISSVLIYYAESRVQPDVYKNALSGFGGLFHFLHMSGLVTFIR